MLKLKKVGKRIAGVTIVDRFTASFPPGRVSALVGPNGAGKTSLFNLITGAMPPDTGSITFHGQQLAGLAMHEIARHGVGRLFQDVRVFEQMSVLDNVVTACFTPAEERPWHCLLRPARQKARQRTIRDKALALLERFGLAEHRHAPAGALSFGQQKLLAIARLLAADCTLLLFDEPTAGVNSAMIRRILDAIARLVEEDESRTVILVEHNMNVVRDIAGWVFFMNEGKLAFTGRTDHVLGSAEVREMYLGIRGGG